MLHISSRSEDEEEIYLFDYYRAGEGGNEALASLTTKFLFISSMR